jgi:hypothetical protein
LKFQLNYRKLDINLTHDDSENDLLRYLQSKQMKTRRVSQALWNQAPSATPEIPEAGRARRKSVAPVAVNNYRRRLSLAVPDPFSEGARRRGKSTGNALKGLDSPARRRLRFKRGAHSLASDDLSDSQNLFPLTESIREDDELNSECDKMSESEHNKTDDKSTTKEDTSKGALQSVINSKSKHGSLKRSKTEDAKGSPSAGVRKGGSFKGQASKPTQMKGFRSPTQGMKHGDRGIKFVSPKHSPSLAKRKPLVMSHSVSAETSEHKQDPSPRSSSMRKNLSYSKAMSEAKDENI